MQCPECLSENIKFVETKNNGCVYMDIFSCASCSKETKISRI